MTFFERVFRRGARSLSMQSVMSHPTIDVAANVVDRQIGLDEGLSAARQLGAWFRLDAAVVTSLSDYNRASALEGGLAQAMALQQVLIAYIEGAEGQNRRKVWAEAAISVFGDWVDIVTFAMAESASVLSYMSAVRYGEQAVALARERGRPEREGAILHRLGALHLDPYQHGGEPAQSQQRIREWRTRSRVSDDLEQIQAVTGPVELGDDGELRFGEPEAELPSVEQALVKAADYFSRATVLRPAPERGYSYKGLAQALYEMRQLGAPIADADFEDVCRLALRDLPTEAVGERLYTKAVLGVGKTGATGLDTDVARLLGSGLAEIVHRDGQEAAWHALQAAAAMTRITNPDTAWKLLLLQQTLHRAWADTKLRARHLRFLTELVGIVEGPAWVRDITAESLDADVERMRTDDKISDEQRGYGFVRLAWLAGTVDRELLGVELADEAVQLLNPMPAHRTGIFHSLYSGLHTGEAVNAFNEDRPMEAIDHYCVAIAYLLDAELTDAALDVLGRVESIVRDAPEGLEWAISYLGPVALRLEARAGAVALRRLQEVYQILASVLIRRGLPPAMFIFLIQMAKGARRSLLLLRGAGTITFDRPGTDLYPGDRPEVLQHPWTDEYLDQDKRLLAYAGGREVRPLATPEDRAADRRAAYSARVWDAMLAAVGEPGEDTVLPERLKELLDPQTILLVHWAVMDADVGPVVVTLLVTAEDVEMEIRNNNELPAGTYAVMDAGRTLFIPPESLFLAELRRLVQRDPRPRTVHRECVEPLANMYQDMFQPVVRSLDRLVASGKTHILLAPYGPYRFFPLHLAGEADRPVCQDFTVSYLSDIAGLDRPSRRSPSAPRHPALLAFGLTYDDRDDLPSLRQTVEELRGVTAPFDVGMVLDDKVTTSVVRQALTSTRMLHLRAHGSHDVDAPMLQTVYLTPSAADDGRLFAYEVLGLDLAGLELVTLSACETGLGRFDEGDNVAGFAANLLVAGCGNVVSTLWPAAERASTAFFPALYEALADGATVRQAFQQAQKLTRSRFAEYRDWGTFVLYEG
ncbi:CHAT domain-containing protein [Streptomyces sp. NPDC001178]